MKTISYIILVINIILAAYFLFMLINTADENNASWTLIYLFGLALNIWNACVNINNILNL